jgi:hypothetical protein
VGQFWLAGVGQIWLAPKQGHLASNMAIFESTMPVKQLILAQNITLDGHPGGHQAILALP